MWSTVTRSVSSVTRLRVGALAWVEPWTSTLWSGSLLFWLAQHETPVADSEI